MHQRNWLTAPSLRHAAAPAEPSSPQPGAGGGRPRDDVPAVRFSSAVEEIAPAASAERPRPDADAASTDVAADQLKALSRSLHGRPLQERRMNTYQFEAFSLPPSRVRTACPCRHRV